MSKLTNRFWEIAIRKTDNTAGLPNLEVEFNVVKNPWWGWAADPFLFNRDGRIYLFAEVYSLIKQKGCLAYCEVVGTKTSRWHKIIEEPYHLSYPNIMECDGEIYICPESYQCKEVYFYKAKSFPDIWERNETIIKGSPVSDTTFFKDGDTVYGFTFNHTTEPVRLDMFLIKNGKAEFPQLMPISTDESSARPGGNFFRTERGNIRVGQNGVGVYGSGLAFMRVKAFQPKYEEELLVRWDVHTVKVNKMPKSAEGIHTFNRLGDLEVIDIRYRANNLLDFLGRLFRAIKRRL